METTTGGAPAHTGSRVSRVLGVACLVGLGLLLFLGLVASPADAVQGEAVRLMYLHVPAAIDMYVATGLLGVASGMWLWKRTQAWDVLAGAAAEVAAVFTTVTLVTGMVWGRPTWGVYWVWDARLTTTAMLLVLLLGYLALRRVPGSFESRARRSAIAGLLLVVDLPLIKFSVDWWRTLHQDATISTTDAKIDGLMLFSLFTGMVVGALVLVWLLVHRFRLAWLEEEVEAGGLDLALAERRAEAGVGA